VTPGSQRRSKLFDLLPALYRLKDAQLATAQQLSMGPLESLLTLVEEQLSVVDNDLEQLYDDQFIETCAPWVIPYIGDLIGYQPVHGVAPAVASPRAEVAHTISFRRRKGTVLALEQLARDVTGWGAHAVEFFQLLVGTQYMKHVRPLNFCTPDLRSWQVAAYLDTAFDGTAHQIDVRRIAVQRGRYNIPNIGIFLWSLNAYSLSLAPLTASASNSAGQAQCFRFSPLGRDIPLFTNPVSQGSQITTAAMPVNVPDRLLRRVLCQDLQSGAGAAYYGEGKSLVLKLGGQILNPYQIQVCNLSGPDGSWANLPPSTGNYPYSAAIDPELGRLALPPSAGSNIPEATFYYGFNADMAGGEYAREQEFLVESEVLQFPDTSAPPRYSTLQEALDFAASQLSPQGQIAVELNGSGVSQPAYRPGAQLSINVPVGAAMEIRGAQGSWPTLILNGGITVSGGASSSLVLNGLLVTSRVAPGQPSGTPPVALVQAPATAPGGSNNQLGTLTIKDCTLVPGWALAPNGAPQYGDAPALAAAPAQLQIVIQRSIVGGLQIEELVQASLTDSILDATSSSNIAYSASDSSSAGGPLTLQGCTVIGKVHATVFTLVSNSIIWAELASGDSWSSPFIADRKQVGCVRFSYLPLGSVTPRQFECIAQDAGSPPPLFYSLRYGDPMYAKLLPSTDNAIRNGADDGGEMGAFHFVLAPLRETDLRVRMQEFLPVGIEFGIFYET
jgi:hypothetical protein